MKFGTKRSNESDEAKSGGGGGSGRYAKTFKKGDTEIVFLEEMDDWTGYWEHFDPSLGTNGKSFPCTGDRNTCPGCTSESERVSKASKRYLVNALVKGYVDVWKIPSSLVNTLETRATRDGGSIMNSEYVVIKSGTGLDTDYDAERNGKSNVDPAKFADKMISHDEILEAAYKDAIGDVPVDPDDNQDTEPRKPRVTAKPKEEPKEEAPAKPPVSDDPPSEPQQEQGTAAEESGDDEVELSEEQLRAMSAEEIKGLFKQCGIEAPDTDDTDALADALMAALG